MQGLLWRLQGGFSKRCVRWGMERAVPPRCSGSSLPHTLPAVSCCAVQVKLREFLQLMPRDQLEAAQLQVSTVPF